MENLQHLKEGINDKVIVFPLNRRLIINLWSRKQVIFTTSKNMERGNRGIPISF